MLNIYRLVYTLLHIASTIISTLKQAWADLREAYTRAAEYFGSEITRGKKTDVDYLIKNVRRIEKTRLPNHLVLILGLESPSFADIVSVIGWCATAGIPCVSFYDHDGLLKKCENEVRRELAKSKPELVDYVDWNSGCPVKAVRNRTNGAKHKMQVQLVSYVDGKREIAQLAQSLGKGVITGALKAEEVTQELLENKLELGGLPDPDLAIVCGKTCCTYGLLPWHIKITEFLLLDSHRNFKVTDFVRLLEKYAKCEQRYGK